MYNGHLEERYLLPCCLCSFACPGGIFRYRGYFPEGRFGRERPTLINNVHRLKRSNGTLFLLFQGLIFRFGDASTICLIAGGIGAMEVLKDGERSIGGAATCDVLPQFVGVVCVLRSMANRRFHSGLYIRVLARAGFWHLIRRCLL